MTQAVLVYGEALVDRVPLGDAGAVTDILGGSGFNTALALARCGAQVALAASLSRDSLGQRFRERMFAEGIDQRLTVESAAPTPTATVDGIDAQGGATYRFALSGTAFDTPAPPPADLSAFAHLHVTSFGATLGPSGQAALALLRAARAAGLGISYDLNIRMAALPSAAETWQAVEVRVALCDLVKLSVEDAAVFGSSAGDIADRWLAQGLPLALLTQGERGAELLDASGGSISACTSASRVVDTIGAGDSFMGAFLASAAQHGALGPDLRTLPRDMAVSAMEFAAQIAAETVAERGCNPPRRSPPRVSALPACEHSR